MNASLTYSIIEHLKEEVPEVCGRVHWVYDGINLDDEPRPHLRVDSMVLSSIATNAGRREFSETHLWQIGVFAGSDHERAILSYKVAEVLRMRDIPFYSVMGEIVESTDLTFVADVSGATTIHQERVERESHAHRTYLDVEVRIFRRNGDGYNYTQ